MPYCYKCGNEDAYEDGCSKCDSQNVGEEEMDYCYTCGNHGHWYDLGAEEFEAEDDCRESKEEVKKLRRKIALLDKLYDRDNALHYEILGSAGFFKEHELKGLFSEKDLKDYEYWTAETFEATKGMDTYAQPIEELKIKPTKAKVGILLASIVAGGLWYSNKMKE